MPRGPKKHLKRMAAPKKWMLDKLGGVYAPRPSTGPHKLRESLPLVLLMRNRLKYALRGREVLMILMQRLVKVDERVRTDIKFPTGIMDVISIEKNNEHFRILYDEKGRFIAHKISAEEATYKLLKVKKRMMGAKKIPFVVTHDGRTIRFPDPLIRAMDTIKFNLKTNKIESFIKFDVGNVAMAVGGRNAGRVGVIVNVKRHHGEHTIVHVEDSIGKVFATRESNIFVIGKGKDAIISLPSKKGIRLTILEESKNRLEKEATKKKEAKKGEEEDIKGEDNF